jgi:ABC-2 type transport system ATP-binding protein
MTAVIEAEGVTRRFGSVTAVDAATFRVEEHSITGLLGRNGAGKTTLMQLITGQQFPSAGALRVFGEPPAERADVLDGVCFVKESQRYPDEFRLVEVLANGAAFFPHWDASFAAELADAFRIPPRRAIKKLSRGQQSAVGIVVGLAARAPLTLFDEPYLGLDAVARQLFYDRLLADYAERPRTVLLSTHLIDEVADLLERVVLIDAGRVLVDDDADALRGSATAVAGTASAVEVFASGRPVLHREALGAFVSVTIDGLDDAGRAEAIAAGLELGSVSLQQLVVHKTTAPADRSKEISS